MAEQHQAEARKTGPPPSGPVRGSAAVVSGKAGYSDVLGFYLKGLSVVLIFFAVIYLLMQDLKSSETQKIAHAFLQSAQENVRDLEVIGEHLNNYLIASGDTLDKKDTTFIWDMLDKGNLAQGLLWFSPYDGKWRQMDSFSRYNVREVFTEGNLSRFHKKLVEKAQLGQNRAVLDMDMLSPVLPSSNFKDPEQIKGLLPWLFAYEYKPGNYGFLILLPEISKLFALEQVENGVAPVSGLALFTPHSENEMFRHGGDNQGSGGLFKPMRLRQGIVMAGESWETEILAPPTTAYRVFTVLPWAGLVLGFLCIGAGGVLLHRGYLKERQLAHISEALSSKNTELLNRETERQKLITEFQKSEWEYRSIINAVSDVIFETDQTGKILFLNDKWRDIMQAEADYAINTNLFDYLHPSDLGRHKELFQGFTSGDRGSYRREARMKTESGDFRFVELGFSMIRMSESGSRVVGTITDIEQRKKAELAHDSAEKQYREMFENALNGIYQATPEGKFVSVNQAFADILGYADPEDLKEAITSIRDQIYVDPHERAVLELQVAQHGKVFGVEHEVYKKDGSTIWVLENLRAVYGSDDEVKHFEGNLWDVTSRRAADEALKSAKLEAELTSRARIEFMANMSHELRTPLNAVIGFSEIIRNEVMGPIGQDVYKEYAQDIHDSGKQLLNIINDILELSQIEIGDRELKEKSFPMARIIQSVLSLLDHKIKEGQLRVDTSIPEDLPNIFAEELAMKQVLMNVVSNCVKFTPPGGKIGITVSIDPEEHMMVEITDTGVGMTEEELAKAMQPFGQVETELDRDTSGTGLGLSIVQALVDLHRGRFMIASQKEKGTTVKMVFPKERVVPKPYEAPREEDETQTGDNRSAGLI